MRTLARTAAAAEPGRPGEFTKTSVSVITSASVGHRGSSHRLGYVLAAALLLATIAGGTPPNPLYVLYQKQTRFGPLGVTVVFSAFVIGALLALLALGDLSDHVGRVHAGRPRPRTGSRRTVFLADGPGNLTSNRHYIVTAARSTLVIPEGDDHHD